MKEQTVEMMAKAIETVGFLDWAKAQEIGNVTGDKPRAIVASATRQGLPYKRQERTSKDGSKVQSKADLVSVIASNLDLEIGGLDGLDKATKSALELIAAATS